MLLKIYIKAYKERELLQFQQLSMPLTVIVSTVNVKITLSRLVLSMSQFTVNYGTVKVGTLSATKCLFLKQLRLFLTDK
jgi:hypothetical protein